jgi:hypothetical protein
MEKPQIDKPQIDKPRLDRRKVEIDFSDARIHGNARAPEFSQFWNGMSSMVPYLEGFLNRSVRSAVPLLPEHAKHLKAQADWFTWQEGRHTKLHLQLNDKLHREAYDWLVADEQGIKADFERFFTVKGPKFALAYSEGFETYGPIIASFLFDHSGDLLANWDQPTIFLWVWHLAEEYEHRTVCNHIYTAVYDDYWYRIYGLIYALCHLSFYSFRVTLKMIAADRRAGRIKNTVRSRLRFLGHSARMFGFILPRVLLAMKPGYDPIHQPPPSRAMELLDELGKKYGIKEPT